MSEFNKILNKKAVALKYDETRAKAPVIVAAGAGYLAEKIMETASEHGIPVYEDHSLATVLSQLQLGVEIPEELYRTVIDIYLYFLKFVPGTELEPGEQEKDMEIEEEEVV